MGIQINGNTDVISAADGSLTVVGADLSNPSSLNVSGVGTIANLVVTGNASIGGTITYQDVTHVDSVGIITAQQGIQVLANGLDVTGVSTFSSDISIADKIIHTGDTDTSIRFPAADTFTVETAGSERFRINDSLKEVKNGNLRITSTFIEFSGDVSTPSAAAALYRPADNEFAISTGNAERFRIDSSGRLMVGNTAAADLTGNAANNLVVGPGNANAGITVYTGTGNYGSITFADGTSGDADYRGAINYHHNGDSMRFRTAATERLRIDSTGNVGINTDNPGAKLHVYGNSASQVVTLTDGATITPDFSTGNNFTVTLGGNRTLANPTNTTVGQSGVIYIVQDGTGSRTLGVGTHWHFPAGTAPTLTTTGGSVDVFAFSVRSSTSVVANAILDVKVTA